jgi:Heterokaryon incompatibility protein (HET)
VEAGDQGCEFVLAKDKADSLQRPMLPPKENPNYPSLHSGSEECIGLLEDWCHVCVSQHKKGVRRVLPLPTRLFDVSPEGNDSVYTALLASKNLYAPRAATRYVALSYCWGNVSPFPTTKKNSADRLNGIPLSDLAVYRDAVHITRRCEIKYMWVDSHCVCPDDQEFGTQAAKMGEFYARCFFAFSALSSANSNVGIFRPRKLGSFFTEAIISPYSFGKDTLNLFIIRSFDQFKTNPRAAHSMKKHGLSKTVFSLQL